MSAQDIVHVKMLRSVIAAGLPRKAGELLDLTRHEFQFLESRGLVREIAQEKHSGKKIASN